LFTQEKPSKSSIHVKRDLYIKVNTSLCYPKKLLKALLKEKSPFPDESGRLAGLSLETRDPKKSSNVSFPPIYAIYATKSEFIEIHGSAMQ
jgi:hypothetical protein